MKPIFYRTQRHFNILWLYKIQITEVKKVLMKNVATKRFLGQLHSGFLELERKNM